MINHAKETQVTLTPSTSVYSTFERLNYEQYSAYAEFIDNSTQSYFDHQLELKDNGSTKCLIKINHDSLNGVITITDNAYGMDFEDFKRAIILDSPPKNPNSRNEFGMGLKTAATWFGSKWSVKSTRLNTNEEYSVTVDVDDFKKYGKSTVNVKINPVERNTHYTTIVIEKLHRRAPLTKTLDKLKSMIGGIYRRDIESGNVEIYYNDVFVSYKPPSILMDGVDEFGEPKLWRKEVKFDVADGEKTYKVDGFIALRETGSSEYAGFTLFRNNRVIVGGFDDTYRPREVFGQKQSYPYQRLFGEFNLDGWPVTQAKDKIAWDNELEQKFIDQLKSVSNEYRIKAEKHRVRSAKKQRDESENNDEETLLRPNRPNESKKSPKSDAEEVPNQNFEIKKSNNEYTEVGSGDIKNNLKIDRECVVNYKGDEFHFNVLFIRNPAAGLMTKETNEKKSKLTINLDHPLMKKYGGDDEKIDTLASILVYLSLSENAIRVTASRGNVQVEAIRIAFDDVSKTTLEWS